MKCRKARRASRLYKHIATSSWHVILQLRSSELPTIFSSPIMSSRINIGRPQTNTYNIDPHGLANSRPSSGYRAANPDDPFEKIRAVGKQIEDYIEIYSQPLKPYLPAIGRFLIVVTFIEDALRIVTQWGDQLWYLQQYELVVCFPLWWSHPFHS